MNGLYLFATFVVLGAGWYLTREQPERRRGPHDYGFSRRELIAAVPAGVLAAALFGVSVAAFLVIGPH